MRAFVVASPDAFTGSDAVTDYLVLLDRLV
jgi:hypothetical protein